MAIVGSVVFVAGWFKVVDWDLLARRWLFVRVFSRLMRLTCLLSELLIGPCNLVFCGSVGGWVMGHVDWARLWYCVKVCVTRLAALSIYLVVISVETLRMASRFWASSRASLVALSPSW